MAKTSLSRRIVDEKDIERLSVNSNRALMIFQDQTNTPTPEPLVDTGDQGIVDISVQNSIQSRLVLDWIQLDPLESNLDPRGFT